MPPALNRSSAAQRQQKKKKIQGVQEVPKVSPILRVDVALLDARIQELVTRFVSIQPPLLNPLFVLDITDDSLEKTVYNMISKYSEKILMLHETSAFPSQCLDPALSEHVFKIGQHNSPVLLQLPDRLVQIECISYYPNLSKSDTWRQAFDSRSKQISMLSKRGITPKFLELTRCEKTNPSERSMLSCYNVFLVAVYERPLMWGTKLQIDQLNIYLHNTKQNSPHFPALRDIIARKFKRFPQYYDVQERTFILTDTSTGVPVDAYFFDRLDLDIHAEQKRSDNDTESVGANDDDNSILEIYDSAIKSQSTLSNERHFFNDPGNYSNLLHNYVYGTLLAEGDLKIIT